MRQGLIRVVVIAMAVALLGTPVAARQAHKRKPTAAAAQTTDEQSPKPGGCMPDGSCCGACPAAQPNAKGADAPAPAPGGCPCKGKMKGTK